MKKAFCLIMSGLIILPIAIGSLLTTLLFQIITRLMGRQKPDLDEE